MADTKPPVLTVESLRRTFDLIKEQEQRDRETLIEWGRQYREGTPQYRRYRDARMQACGEILGYYPDPVRPAIVHPKIAEQLRARVKEILSAS